MRSVRLGINPKSQIPRSKSQVRRFLIWDLGFGVWDFLSHLNSVSSSHHSPMAETAATAERTLQPNLEAERSVLGAILVHNDAFNTAAQVIDGRVFYRDAHRRIFDRMVALSERGEA